MDVMWRVLAASLFLTALPSHAGDPLVEYLRASGKPPVAYVLSKLEDHRVVIVGEGHWFRHDTELITALVPELRQRGIALAAELFPSDRQKDIDALVTAPEWDEKLASSILLSNEWPYVQYRDILQAAWKANHGAPAAPPIRILALGPPKDWRAKGIRYDAFMAQAVIDHLTEPSRRVLVYCGMHHAFTRYLQVERRGRGRATEFMDRFGNILWRKYAQDVFLIGLHKPEMCGPASKAESTYCLPFGGRIDCAASTLAHPVAFDILGSPVAEMKFPAESFYAFGHPLLRLIDYADGWVWSEPIDQTRMVDMFAFEAKDPAEAADWKKHAEDLANPLARPAWKGLAKWRESCR